MSLIHRPSLVVAVLLRQSSDLASDLTAHRRHSYPLLNERASVCPGKISTLLSLKPDFINGGEQMRATPPTHRHRQATSGNKAGELSPLSLPSPYSVLPWSLPQKPPILTTISSSACSSRRSGGPLAARMLGLQRIMPGWPRTPGEKFRASNSLSMKPRRLEHVPLLSVSRKSSVNATESSAHWNCCSSDSFLYFKSRNFVFQSAYKFHSFYCISTE